MKPRPSGGISSGDRSGVVCADGYRVEEDVASRQERRVLGWAGSRDFVVLVVYGGPVDVVKVAYSLWVAYGRELRVANPGDAKCAPETSSATRL
ncbi:hypothetical protein PUNSTDRAFT_49542 [Punctularia strigosozonata HHB-11173 SS5]|uniref:uncharacterized protein n=1 Tax=Punctularia strigosozonata (strain HHB-11173) TaxID=741275 RepID=UPI000441681B|nr:uncharacterized protein PUNSTDRAFT_49542 [Punctularia strigosozonata HHB-11173 SS5]EIN12265.1 hypothetical protein PUNSTDRAFT_49542 [Punctularia strigosozonata HHB-11173 SS5]